MNKLCKLKDKWISTDYVTATTTSKVHENQNFKSRMVTGGDTEVKTKDDVILTNDVITAAA